MNRALHKMTDEERAEQITQDKILLFREGWPDMAQIDEPDHMEGEWPLGATLIICAIIGAAFWIGVIAWIVGAV